MTGMTDIHQHLLWGVDDGAADFETTCAMIRSACDQQISRIIATAHAYPGMEPFDLPLYMKRLEEAQRYCEDHKLPVAILPGAEMAWSYNAAEVLRRRQIPTLANTDHVLIELWHNITWGEVRTVAGDVLRAGFTPVFAHIERYRCFLWQPEKALELREDLPIGYQMNASTVLDKAGPVTRRFVKRMLSEEGIDAVASDAHDCRYRPQRLKEAYAVLRQRCSADYADALVHFQGVHR